MASKSVARLLIDRGATRSHSRSETSNDNPFSGTSPKTVKYRGHYPESFVIDIEGFGRGTRTIDLVSLLDCGGGPENRASTGLIRQAAITASDEQTFRACLAHRVLAILISTPEHARRLAAAAERARTLLALAG